MKLKVPLIKQKQKMGCGPTAMSMLYKYFGKDVSPKEIVKEIGGLVKWGSFTTDLAFMARKLGFKVICYSYGLVYFDPGFTKLSRKEFIKKIKYLIRKEKKAYQKRELKSILRVLKSDIDFQMRIPSLKVIRRFLDKRLPVLIGVNFATLFEEKSDLRFGHFIVLTGYSKDKFYYNDPYGKRASISADKLIFASSNNVFESSGYLIVIKNK